MIATNRPTGPIEMRATELSIAEDLSGFYVRSGAEWEPVSLVHAAPDELLALASLCIAIVAQRLPEVLVSTWGNN